MLLKELLNQLLMYYVFLTFVSKSYIQYFNSDLLYGIYLGFRIYWNKIM